MKVWTSLNWSNVSQLFNEGKSWYDGSKNGEETTSLYQSVVDIGNTSYGIGEAPVIDCNKNISGRHNFTIAGDQN
jgi:hypothetical protein